MDNPLPIQGQVLRSARAPSNAQEQAIPACRAGWRLTAQDAPVPRPHHVNGAKPQTETDVAVRWAVRRQLSRPTILADRDESPRPESPAL